MGNIDLNDPKMVKPEWDGTKKSLVGRSIGDLALAYERLKMFLSLEDNANEREMLEFCARLYNESTPLLNEVTRFVITNKTAYENKTIQRSMDLSREILVYLKVFDVRYTTSITSPDPTNDPRWDSISTKSNKEIIEELKKIFMELDPLKKEILGWVFYSSFYLKIKIEFKNNLNKYMVFKKKIKYVRKIDK